MQWKICPGSGRQTPIDFDPSLSGVPGAKWTGQLNLGHTPNVYALPLTVVLQIYITQYVGYLDRLGGKDAHRLVLERVTTPRFSRRFSQRHHRCQFCKRGGELCAAASIALLRLAVCVALMSIKTKASPTSLIPSPHGVAWLFIGAMAMPAKRRTLLLLLFAVIQR